MPALPPLVSDYTDTIKNILELGRANSVSREAHESLPRTRYLMSVNTIYSLVLIPISLTISTPVVALGAQLQLGWANIVQ